MNKLEQISKMKHYSTIYSILLVSILVSSIPLFLFLGVWAFIPWTFIYAFTMYYALKIEKIKKENDIHTYKEIVAFSEGEELDEIDKIKEKAKRPYQKFILIVSSAFITLLVCIGIGFLMHYVTK